MAKRRGNQEGSIYQRKTGRWQALASIEGRRIGKTFDTRKECVEWIKQFSEQKRRGLTFEGASTTFKEYLDQWLRDVAPNLRPATLSQYKWIVTNHINPTLGRVKISDLTPRLIQNFYSEKLEYGTGVRTIGMTHGVIHGSLKMAVRHGLIGSNPAKDVQKPRYNPKRMQVFNEAQIHALLIAAEPAGMKSLIQLAVTTGIRKGELLGLQWQDVDWANSTIRVERQLQRIPKIGLRLVLPKTKTGIRTVKVGSTSLTELGKHFIAQQERRKNFGSDWNEEGFIFPSSTGTAKDPRNLVHEFKALLVDASLPNIRFHDLRHTAASLMLMSDMQLMRITRQLGHAKASTTLDIYGHLIPGLETDAMEKIDQIVSPTATELQLEHPISSLQAKIL